MEPMEGKMAGMPRPGTTISTRRNRIAKLAREAPELVFTSLNHHIDIAWLMEAYRRTRKDSRPGVDGQTWAEYGEDLEANLRSLLNRFKSGTYKAPPVARAYIPKGGRAGKLRPIGIPTLEDKVLQRAVAMVLEPIYEQDFLNNSYGFRPGRSQHQALQSLWQATMRMGGGWILEVDIKGYFDGIDRAQLRAFLDRRVRDGVIRRTVHKWLKAGVQEDNRVHYPEAGTPQGGVISPLLSNIYLHEVMDKWYIGDVRPRMRGDTEMIRFADDIILVFQREDDARRVMAVIGKRFAKYGLKLHPDKTRLLSFKRPPRRAKRPDSKTGSFDFLGFAHYWGRSRKGSWILMRRTAKDRMRRTLREIHEWCKRNRHLKVRDQHKKLVSKVRGHYAYYGITHNSRSLAKWLQEVKRIWRYWLNRRSQRNRMPWSRFHNGVLKHYRLPYPRIVHSYACHAAKP